MPAKKEVTLRYPEDKMLKSFFNQSTYGAGGFSREEIVGH